MEEGMTEKQLAVVLIEKYADLQRIKTALNRDEEIDYQIRTTKTRLSILGIVTENLDK